MNLFFEESGDFKAGAVLSQQGEDLVTALHDAAFVGAGLALLSALTAFATLSGVRVRASRGTG